MRNCFLLTLFISTTAWAAPNACVDLFTRHAALTESMINQRIKNLAELMISIEEDSNINSDQYSRRVTYFQSESNRISRIDPEFVKKFKIELKLLESQIEMAKQKQLKTNKEHPEKNKPSETKKDNYVKEVRSLSKVDISGAHHFEMLPNNKDILLIDSNGLRVIEILTGKIVYQHDEKGMSHFAVTTTVTDQFVITVSGAKVRFFDIHAKKELSSLSLKQKAAISVSPQGKYLIVTYEDNSKDVIDISTRTGIKSYPQNASAHVVVSRDEQNLIYYASTGFSAKISIFNIKENKIIKEIDEVYRYIPEHDLIVNTKSKTQSIEIWDVQTNSLRFSWDYFDFLTGAERGLSINPSFLTLVDSNNTVHIKNLLTGEETATYKGTKVGHPTGLGNFYVSIDRQEDMILIASKLGHVDFPKTSSVGYYDYSYFSRNESFFITSNYNGFLAVIEPNSGRVLFEENTGRQPKLLVTRDEKYILFIDSNKKINVLEIYQGR